MVVKCPACRKDDNRSDLCGRCGCDLSVLRKIMEASQYELEMGKLLLRQGNAKDALFHAVRSWQFKNSSCAAKIAFLSCIMLKEFDSATGWYKHAVSK